MAKDSDERKDDSDKKCDNGDEESYVEVEGGETKVTGDTFRG